MAAALGDDLLAGCDDGAPTHWRVLPQYEGAPPPLPDGIAAFRLEGEAPPALARRLSQIGLVTDEADGSRLQPALLPGQRLVSRDGGAWRWDGYTRRADAPSPAAVRLRQRARLDALRPQRQAAEELLGKVRATYEDRRAAARAATSAEQEQRSRVRLAETALRTATGAMAELRASRLRLEQRLAAADDALRAIAPELEEAAARLAEVEAEIASLPDTVETSAIETLRVEFGRGRAGEVECRARRDLLLRDGAGRARRLQTLETELASWEGRLKATSAQLVERRERLRQAEAESGAT